MDTNNISIVEAICIVGLAIILFRISLLLYKKSKHYSDPFGMAGLIFGKEAEKEVQSRLLKIYSVFLFSLSLMLIIAGLIIIFKIVFVGV